MLTARSLNTYIDRRLRIAVRRDSLVLDVGGGDQPHWRADVIVDRFPDEEHAAQRCFGGGMRVDRPVFAVDAGRLPFRDGVFDFVVCSHTLEHVPDPESAISEMCRVAKRGYIEVPEVGMAKIDDFPTHLWWCSREGDTLVFRAKKSRDFDPDIARVLSDESFRREVLRVANRHFERCIVTMQWTGTVEVVVEGVPDLRLAEKADRSYPSSSVVAGLLRTTSQSMAKGLWRSRRRRQPLTLSSILDGDEFGSPEALLEPRIYRSTR
jgi:SAM-dependent methyltransferase